MGWGFESGKDDPLRWIYEVGVDAILFGLQNQIDASHDWVQRVSRDTPLRPLIFVTTNPVQLEELDEGVNYTIDARHLGDLEHILISLTFGYSSGYSFSIEREQRNAVPRVIVVDDNAQLATAIEHALRAAQPFDVRVVGSGFEAASVLPDFHPDVAIIDLVLGDMDGREVCSFIRNHDALKSVKIIGVSGYLPSCQMDTEKNHFDEFIEKPFRLKDIVDKVRALVQR